MSHLKENDSRLYTVLAKGKLVTYENNITHMTYVVEYDQIHKLLFKQIQKKKYISRLQKMISEFHKHKFEIKTGSSSPRMGNGMISLPIHYPEVLLIYAT